MNHVIMQPHVLDMPNLQISCQSMYLHCESRSPDNFSAQRFERNVWLPVKLRMTAFAIEELDSTSGMLCNGLDRCLVGLSCTGVKLS